MTPDEIVKLQSYLRNTFRNKDIQLKRRGKKEDSVEVHIGEEFIGVISRDDEDEDVTYHFNMAILEFDLEEGGA
jgi:hypothetical protein